jgi:hypothetical protein
VPLDDDDDDEVVFEPPFEVPDVELFTCPPHDASATETSAGRTKRMTSPLC